MAITESPVTPAASSDEVAAKIAGATLGAAVLGPPTVDDIADERAHRKAKLAGALRIFGKFGFAEGVAGHKGGATTRGHVEKHKQRAGGVAGSAGPRPWGAPGPARPSPRGDIGLRVAPIGRDWR